MPSANPLDPSSVDVFRYPEKPNVVCTLIIKNTYRVVYTVYHNFVKFIWTKRKYKLGLQ